MLDIFLRSECTCGCVQFALVVALLASTARILSIGGGSFEGNNDATVTSAFAFSVGTTGSVFFVLEIFDNLSNIANGVVASCFPLSFSLAVVLDADLKVLTSFSLNCENGLWPLCV